MIRKFSNLTRFQQEQLVSVKTDLNRLRHRLADAMYGGPGMPDESIDDIRNIYCDICKVIDKF